MTVSTTNVLDSYAGDDSTTAFVTTFQFDLETDLVVLLVNDTTGAVSTQVLTTDYTVSGGDGSTGTVTFVTAPATGETVEIWRFVSLTQLTDYVANDPFPAETHEAALDKLTYIAQQQAAGLGLTTFNRGSTETLNRLGSDPNNAWDAESIHISNVEDPDSDQDAATKKYVDDLLAGNTNGNVMVSTSQAGAPTVNDDTDAGFNVGDTIVNTSTTPSEVYICTDESSGAAVWERITAFEPFSFETGHTEWADGLSNEEIHRIVLQSGERLVVDRIEFRQKGGGTSASASVRVRDTTAGSTVGSQTLGGTTLSPGSSAAASTCEIQITNSTGAAIDASVRVVGRITS